jgi:uncharacterized membrane protein
MNWKNFVKCGLTGWCMEIVFTSIKPMMNGDFHLWGQTSLWMFPIYGMAMFIAPLYEHLTDWPVICRAAVYACLIMCGEFITGSILTAMNVCPWDYAGATYSIRGVVRLDYFPFWAAAGLVFERLLVDKAQDTSGISATEQLERKPS